MLDPTPKETSGGSAKNWITNQSQFAYKELNENTLLVSLRSGAELLFVGKCEIEVLRGRIEVCGMFLSHLGPKFFMYNVKGYSLLAIKGMQEHNRETDVTRKYIIDPSLSQVFLESPGALFTMRSFESNWCKAMRKYCSRGAALLGPEVLLTHRNHPSTIVDQVNTTPLKQFKEKFGFHFPLKKASYRLFKPSDSWDSIAYPSIGRLISGENLVIGVFGGKGVGKSSLSRWLSNKVWSMASAVYYIDLDPGQAEFTMPGVVSIAKIVNPPMFGPNFIPRDLPQELMVYVGSINMADCPLTYMLAIQRIVDHLKQMRYGPERTVFIINTMGFTQGFGVDFACDIIKMFRMTDVFEIKSTDPRRSFPGLNYDAVSTHTRTFQADCMTHWDKEPLRHYRYYSAFSACDDSGNESGEASQGSQWGNNSSDLRDTVICSYFAKTITKPGDLSLTSVIPKDIVISASCEEQAQLKKLKHLNGSLVALCGYPSGSVHAPVRSCDSNTSLSAKLNYDYNYSDLNCLGFGLIRAIDLKKGILYVVTPVQNKILKGALDYVIPAGCIATPLSLHLQMSSNAGSIAPYVMDSRRSGTKLHKVTRKNYIPKRLKKKSGNTML